MSTKNLRNAVQATSAAGQADLGEALLGLHTFAVTVERAVCQLLRALADPEASGTLDPGLVSELLDNPQSFSFFLQYLRSHRTPESADLIEALTDELSAANAYAQPLGDTVPESWTTE